MSKMNPLERLGTPEDIAAAVAYLAYYSRDEIFSTGALGFVTLAFYARVREPRLIERV